MKRHFWKKEMRFEHEINQDDIDHEKQHVQVLQVKSSVSVPRKCLVPLYRFLPEPST